VGLSALAIIIDREPPNVRQREKEPALLAAFAGGFYPPGIRTSFGKPVVTNQRASAGTIHPNWLRADSVKMFADGVVEYPAQTAALLHPYLDGKGQPTNNSVSNTSTSS
jgi:hypothetical protein